MNGTQGHAALSPATVPANQKAVNVLNFEERNEAQSRSNYIKYASYYQHRAGGTNSPLPAHVYKGRFFKWKLADNF